MGLQDDELGGISKNPPSSSSPLIKQTIFWPGLNHNTLYRPIKKSDEPILNDKNTITLPYAVSLAQTV